MADVRRLLILSCSKRKRLDPGYMQAIERYDGPAFRVLRRYLRECPDRASRLDVYVLSAAYGLISSTHPIVDYNRMMTKARAAELRDKVLEQILHLQGFRYGSLCLAMSKAYILALDGWTTLVPQHVRVTLTYGPQGAKLAQLKRWLWESTSDNAEGEQLATEPCGYACIRGMGIDMTPGQVFGVARKALAEGRGKPDQYQSWYVQVDGRRVAPKWLVSQLTGLPVSAFVTKEARRVLAQLGIKVTPI